MKKTLIMSSIILSTLLITGCNSKSGTYQCNNNQSITLNDNGTYIANVWGRTFDGTWKELDKKSIKLQGLANSHGRFNIDGNTITFQQGMLKLECHK